MPSLQENSSEKQKGQKPCPPNGKCERTAVSRVKSFQHLGNPLCTEEISMETKF